MTLMSWSARAGFPGSGYQWMPQWTTVSGSIAGSRRERVGVRASVSTNSVRSSSAGGDVLDRGVALEAAGELGAPPGRDAGDRYAPHPPP